MTSTLATITGAAPITHPYSSHSSAPSIWAERNAIGRTKKYDPTKVAVAAQPRVSANVMFLPRDDGRCECGCDLHVVGARLLPFVQRQAVVLEQSAYLPRTPIEDLVKHRHHDAERIVTHHRASGDACQLLVIRNRDREPVVVVDV